MSIVNYTNVTGIQDLLVSVNTGTNDVFWVAILFMVFLVMLFIMSKAGLEASLLISSFVGIIVGVLMAVGNLIAWRYVLILFGILIFIVLIIYYSSSRTG